ncbi:monocarboxylate transporter 12-like [Ruditapes philippinarum]|uniref:monocarboxylate transporter 12-like n=1 Tax=Ruditapes philippinarum TaxID=129788 RepID=UPI00295C1815|nr:monocarboxylate transporter 12-like [Ruditapes philippinarum]
MAVQKDEKRTDVDTVDPDVDHGYAWVILAGCFMMYCLVIGTIKAYGILYTEMVSYYGTGSGNTAWIGSMVLLLVLGLWLGYGLSFSPCSTIITCYFKKHTALANGIVVSGSGIGALTYPAIYSFFIKKYGLHGAFWVIGGILLNVCVAACVFKQPKLLLKEKESQESTGARKDLELLLKKVNDDQKSKDTLTNCYGLDFRFSLFRNPRFSMYCVSVVLCMNGYGNTSNLIMIPAYIKDVGYDTTHAVYGVTKMGGCEVVARIAFGLIADRNIMKRKHIFFFLSMLIAPVFSFIAPFFDIFVFLGVYAGVIGTFPGSFWSLVSVLIIDVVGMEDFAPAFGLVMLCLAFGVVISQPAVGTYSYNMSLRS